MDMLMDMMKAMSATSTTPAPGAEIEALMGIMCTHKDTITCISTEAACADEDGSAESLSAITCLCDCPSLTALTSGGDSMEAMCKDTSMLDCMFTTESCSGMMKMMTEAASGMSADDFKKGLVIGCKREELGCDAKLEKTGECAGDALMNWGNAGCEEDITEVCCPWAETLVGCMGKECMKLQTAMYKVGADAGDAGSKKEMKQGFKVASVCTGLGLPKNEEEAAALVSSSTGSDGAEPSTTDFAYHAAPVSAAATALCALAA